MIYASTTFNSPPHNHYTKNTSAHHQRLPPPARCSAFHCFLRVVFLLPAHQRWRQPPCCTRQCPPKLRKLHHCTKLSWHLTKRRWCTEDRQETKEYFCRQLESFRQEIRNHYIEEFGGSHRVYAYGPHSCQFYSTSLQALLSLDYVPHQVKIPCCHLPHVCAYCPCIPLPNNLWGYVFVHISAWPRR